MLKIYQIQRGLVCIYLKLLSIYLQVLKHQGAVPFVRTNIPQTMMTYECSNPIWGRTCNPYDTSKIPGGSSGGEGALIGGGGSILGLGSDIGGSVRIPAHMSGCCSLKPTCGRIRYCIPFSDLIGAIFYLNNQIQNGCRGYKFYSLPCSCVLNTTLCKTSLTVTCCSQIVFSRYPETSTDKDILLLIYFCQNGFLIAISHQR